MDINETIKSQLEENPIILYMKGSPQAPQCGFSAKTVQAVMACGERFAFVNILDNQELREALKVYSSWPTYPSFTSMVSSLADVTLFSKCPRAVSWPNLSKRRRSRQKPDHCRSEPFRGEQQFHLEAVRAPAILRWLGVGASRQRSPICSFIDWLDSC